MSNFDNKKGYRKVVKSKVQKNFGRTAEYDIAKPLVDALRAKVAAKMKQK